ncbi:MAG: hypothetical protein MJ138_06075, partial [Kiritimatiellae bacterium]|nr:hypothetical protein [Kiritimatiellia bacterium]
MSGGTAKQYAESYLAPGKPVWLVGLSFERGTRRFVEGAVARVKVDEGRRQSEWRPRSSKG